MLASPKSPASVTRPEKAAATRKAIVDAARQLFVEQGYFETSTEQIVALAGVGTRGALYHHFADKEALFAEIFDLLEAELFDEIVDKVQPDRFQPLEAIVGTALAFLDCLIEREDARVVMRDGPLAMGPQRFREIEAGYGLDAIENHLRLAMEQATATRAPTRPLASLILSMIHEAAVYVCTAQDTQLARREMGQAMTVMVAGLGI